LAVPSSKCSLRVVLAPTRYDRDRARGKDIVDVSSRSSTLVLLGCTVTPNIGGRPHIFARVDTVVATLCVNPCRGASALCALAPGPRPHDVLVWSCKTGVVSWVFFLLCKKQIPMKMLTEKQVRSDVSPPPCMTGIALLSLWRQHLVCPRSNTPLLPRR